MKKKKSRLNQIGVLTNWAPRIQRGCIGELGVCINVLMKQLILN